MNHIRKCCCPLLSLLLLSEYVWAEQFLNPEVKLKALTLIATRTIHAAGEERSERIRLHATPETIVEFHYPVDMATRMEAKVDSVVDFSSFHPKDDPRVRQMVLSQDEQQHYQIGGGVNQLDTWQNNFYTHSDLERDSGLAVGHVLRSSWPSDEYTVDVQVNPPKEDGARAPSKVFTVHPKGYPDYVVNEVRFFASREAPECAERLEYFREGELVLVVENSRFWQFEGLSFPTKIERYSPDEPEVREVYDIAMVIPNPDVDPALLGSPVIHSGARVFIHQDVHGKDLALEGPLDPNAGIAITEILSTLEVGDGRLGVEDVDPTRRQMTESASVGSPVSAPIGQSNGSLTWSIGASVGFGSVMVVGVVLWTRYSKRKR